MINYESLNQTAPNLFFIPICTSHSYSSYKIINGPFKMIRMQPHLWPEAAGLKAFLALIFLSAAEDRMIILPW